MAHTDRDDARWFWNDHFKWDFRTHSSKHLRTWGNEHYGAACWCDEMPEARKWVHPYRYESGVPSSWNRSQRKAERNKLRQQVQKARNGRIDWDDMPFRRGQDVSPPVLLVKF